MIIYFHILYLMEKWGCKQVYWDTNLFFPAPFEPCDRKKYRYVTSCPCVRIVHYALSMLVKIMDLFQLFFNILTLKALVQLNVTNCYGSDLNVSMNQTPCSCARIVHYIASILVKIMNLSQLFYMLTLKALM